MRARLKNKRLNRGIVTAIYRAQCFGVGESRGYGLGGTEMADVNLCKDCRHFIYDGKTTAACGNSRQPVLDLVHGSPALCQIARLDPSKLSPPEFNTCGPTGRWFEPKEIEG